MGWNNLQFKKKIIYKKLKKNKYPKISAYFVHSYNFDTKNSEDKINNILWSRITAMVSKDNIIGVQFHPREKPQI